MKIIKIYKYKNKNKFYAQITFPSTNSYYNYFKENKEKITKNLKNKLRKDIDLDIITIDKYLEKLSNKLDEIITYPYYTAYIDVNDLNIYNLKEIK